VATARTLTSPAVHPRSGEAIFPGLALGTELGWATRIGGPAPNPLGADFVKYAVFKNPDWDWRTFDLETAVVQADRIDVVDASADLRAFMRRGGKLLLYHGWDDQNFSAQSTIDYYRKVVDAIGSRADAIPSPVSRAGYGALWWWRPNAFDMVSALGAVVEQSGPALIVASPHRQSWVGLGRCPYPQVSMTEPEVRRHEFPVRAVTRDLMLLISASAGRQLTVQVCLSASCAPNA
jgi:feruloyl esterase